MMQGLFQLDIPYKFKYLPEDLRSVWIECLLKNTSAKVFTLYYHEERSLICVASGGPAGWVPDLHISLEQANDCGFELTVHDTFLEINLPDKQNFCFEFFPGLRGSEIHYVNWGKAVTAPLSLVPNSQAGSINSKSLEDLPIEYSILHARLCQLEEACRQAGVRI